MSTSYTAWFQNGHQIHLPSDDQLSVKTFSGFERLSLWPPSQDDKDIFKITPNSKKHTCCY